MCRLLGDQCWTSPHYCYTACCPSGLGNDPPTGISDTVKKSVLHFSRLLARHAVLVFDEFSIGYRNRRLRMRWIRGGGGEGVGRRGREVGVWAAAYVYLRTRKRSDTLRSCLYTRCQIHRGAAHVYLQTRKHGARYTEGSAPPPTPPPPPPPPCLLAVKCSETTSLSKSDPYFSPSLSILLHSLHQTLVLTATARWLSTSGPQTETAQA